MPHEIEVTINADGEVEFHVEGMKGKGCVPLLKEFEKALGIATSEGVKTTTEFLQVEAPTTVKAK